MTHCTLFRIASLIGFTLSVSALAYAAGPQRTFVSAQHGDDANTANNCSVMLPCRNFNAAVAVVNAGGEVVALDSGGYGSLIISKAVTVTGPSGVYVAITSQAQFVSGILINAANTDTVILRGLTVTGLGALTGIEVTSVGNLHIEGCVVSGFLAGGIKVQLSAGGSQIFIKDTITRNNGDGILMSTSTGVVKASIDNCRAERNSVTGFGAFGNSQVTVNRSIATGNTSGFVSTSNAAGITSELSCAACVSSNNAEGFVDLAISGGASIMRVSNSTATNNASSGLSQLNDGVFKSLGNNLVHGNGTDIIGTVTIIPAH